MHCLAILNPASGSIDIERTRAELRGIADSSGIDLSIHEVSEDEDLGAVASDAVRDGVSRIIVGGGDGTVAEVASAVMGRAVEIAVLPCGTANLLARSLAIPESIDKAAALALLGQESRRIDGMQVEGKLLLVHISIGTYSKIAAETSQQDKQRLGRLAYVINALREVYESTRWRVKIVIDGVSHHHYASFVLLANVSEVGSLDWEWAEGSEPDDGCIEVCIVNTQRPLDYFRFLYHVIRGNPRAFEGTTQYRARKSVEMQNRLKLPVRGDGEVLPGSPLVVKVIPAALKVIAPSSSRD